MTTRREWMARVASHAAANLGASSPDEVVAEFDELSETEQERVEWAIEEVQRRLYRFGEYR